MAAKLKSFHVDSHSKNASSIQSSKMHNLHIERGQELLKALIRKRADKENKMETKPCIDSKKTCINSAHNLKDQGGEELLKVVRKGTEKLNIKESKKKNKSKSGTLHSKKMCLCSPTTHEGSFRCHLHRISAAKKSSTEKKSTMKLNSKRAHGVLEFKPQLSRFGRVASAEVGPHDGPIQLSGVDSA